MLDNPLFRLTEIKTDLTNKGFGDIWHVKTKKTSMRLKSKNISQFVLPCLLLHVVQLFYRVVNMVL